MSRLTPHDEFQGKCLKRTAIELSSDQYTCESQSRDKQFLEITRPRHDLMKDVGAVDFSEWGARTLGYRPVRRAEPTVLAAGVDADGGADMSLGVNACSATERMELTASNRPIGSFHLDAALVLPDPRGELAANGVRVAADSTFPYDRHAPAGIDKGRNCYVVAFLVASQLLVPEIGAGFGKAEVGAVSVAMPEAAMHKHSRFPFRQNQVGPTRQPLDMQSIPEAGAPELLPYPQFGAGVLAPDT